MSKKQNFLSYFSTRNIAVIAILSAISFILYMFVKFPLPFLFPGFLDMQFSDLPALLGGFAIGPLAGGIIIVIKCLLKMPFTSTAFVGELADIIVGLAFVLPAAFFYKFNRTKKGAILALIIGTVSAVGVSLLANRFILIPFFAKAYGMNAVVGMMQALYPNITAQNVYDYYIPLAALPFNTLRCVICSMITYFVYKPLSKIMHGESKSRNEQTDKIEAQVDDKKD